MITRLGQSLLSVFCADWSQFARRFGIEPFAAPCSVCGALIETSIPIARGTLRGLAAPDCICGNKSTHYALVRDPRFGDLLSGSLAK